MDNRAEYKQAMALLDSKNQSQFDSGISQLDQYFLSLLTKNQEWPPFIKQKDLMRWLQIKFEEPGFRPEKLKIYFDNFNFLDRLLLGKGSEFYEGSKLHPADYYKNRYKDEGLKLVISFFVSGHYVDKKIDIEEAMIPYAKEVAQLKNPPKKGYENIQYLEIAENKDPLLFIKSSLYNYLCNPFIEKDLETKKEEKPFINTIDTVLQKKWLELFVFWDPLIDKQKQNPGIDILGEHSKSYVNTGSKYFIKVSNALLVFKYELPPWVKNADLIKLIICDPVLFKSILKGGAKEGLLKRFQENPELLKDIENKMTELNIPISARTKVEEFITFVKTIKKELPDLKPSTVAEAPKVPEEEIKKSFAGKYAYFAEEMLTYFKRQPIEEKLQIQFPNEQAAPHVIQGLKNLIDQMAKEKNENLKTQYINQLEKRLSQFFPKHDNSELAAIIYNATIEKVIAPSSVKRTIYKYGSEKSEQLKKLIRDKMLFFSKPAGSEKNFNGLGQGDVALNQLSQGTTFIEQHGSDNSYVITCPKKPTNTASQTINNVEIPNDDYLIYAYAQIEALMKAMEPNDKRPITIETKDEQLHKAYVIFCHMYGLTLKNSNQYTSNPEQIKQAQLRMAILLSKQKQKTVEGPLTWVKNLFAQKPTGQSTSSSTNSIGQLLGIKNKPRTDIEILCATAVKDVEKYSKQVHDNSGTAAVKLKEDYNLLKTLQGKKDLPENIHVQINAALEQIESVLPKEENKAAQKEIGSAEQKASITTKRRP